MIKVKRLSNLALAILLGILISACSKETPSTPKTSVLPEVNDENCKTENIKKIENKEVREKFADLCIRGNIFKPSPKKSW
jgi:entry exclusion lipoprotein TrbK